MIDDQFHFKHMCLLSQNVNFKDWIREKWEIREKRDQMVTCHYKQDDVDQGSVDNFVILHSHDISPFS